MFDLAPDYKHFSGFLLAPHPKPVREAIEGYRNALDRNPAKTVHDMLPERTGAVREAAARFIGAKAEEVAMTDSTTMGLGLVYGGLKLRAGQEIVTTEYDHYSTHSALTFRAMRDSATVRKVGLFEHSAKANEAEIVKRLMAAVTAKTRVVAVTWVHSMSGVRLPIRAIADALAEKNKGRDEGDRALLIVDGVHGFGIDPVTMDELGADMFIAGTHKWVFGPRGTGLVWGKQSAWNEIHPNIPPFEMQSHMQWVQQGTVATEMAGGFMHSPGGFHSFEHRWALPAAFEFQDSIGRKSIGERVHALNRQLKEGLASINGVELFTPMSDALSAGITCFMLKGRSPHEVVEKLGEKKFIASTTPYKNTYARLAPGLLNTTSEVDAVLGELRAMV
jgi:selenocysteine lyase/cysteine desulfurase